MLFVVLLQRVEYNVWMEKLGTTIEALHRENVYIHVMHKHTLAQFSFFLCHAEAFFRLIFFLFVSFPLLCLCSSQCFQTLSLSPRLVPFAHFVCSWMIIMYAMCIYTHTNCTINAWARKSAIKTSKPLLLLYKRMWRMLTKQKTANGIKLNNMNMNALFRMQFAWSNIFQLEITLESFMLLFSHSV